MGIYYLKPVFAAVTAECLTRELAAYAVWWANAQPSERAGKEPPQLPRGVRYSEQGAFLLDAPGDGDIRVSVTDYVVRDHADKPSTMTASEFERLYEAQSDEALQLDRYKAGIQPTTKAGTEYKFPVVLSAEDGRGADHPDFQTGTALSLNDPLPASADPSPYNFPPYPGKEPIATAQTEPAPEHGHVYPVPSVAYSLNNPIPATFPELPGDPIAVVQTEPAPELPAELPAEPPAEPKKPASKQGSKKGGSK